MDELDRKLRQDLLSDAERNAIPRSGDRHRAQRETLRRVQRRDATSSAAVVILGLTGATLVGMTVARWLSPSTVGTRSGGGVAAAGGEGSWANIAKPPIDPEGHLKAQAVWTGDEMVVIEGGSWGREPFVYGAAYSPSNGSWRTIAQSPLKWRDGFSAVWTGDGVIVWGGANEDGRLSDGAVYEPSTDTWSLLPQSPLAGRSDQVAAWTGQEMVVAGGCCHASGGPFNDAAAFDPASGTWHSLPPMPDQGREKATAVWDGNAVLVWGGFGQRSALSSGLAYVPGSNRWSRLPDAPIPGRERHTAVWTGREMVVWGGGPRVEDGAQFADGAAYDPQSGDWRILADAPIGPRQEHSAVWTGHEMIVWGGTDRLVAGGAFGGLLDDGAVYDPVSDHWTTIADGPLAGRFAQSAVWTGSSMVVFGGCCRDAQSAANFRDGAIFRP